ncbi:biliverdin-producing heme oxygenase [Nocardioides marinquilinus]|uniref:heme oxygenase (biliverdin-producing) n=1 Tax=Nocardioides marinquilinus TaxID=1210400 RepID=A0ABP9PNU6_9ACTN
MTLTHDGAPAVLPASLSAAMRDGSRAEHEAAEGSAFMTELLEARLPASGYAEYLLRLRVVYATLEDAVRRHAGDPLVAAVHDPALERLAALDADLAHWAPGRAHDDLDSPAAEAYRAHLDDAARRAAGGWGGGLVAHHYTRYLGDLSGGQAIGRILERGYDTHGAGVAFYAFDAVPKPKPYKDAYRARLDALALDAQAVAAVVDDVRAVFGLNQALFAELGERLGTYPR